METEKHKAFARALAKVCRDHKAHALDITFVISEPFAGPFEQARMTYNAGRHGSEGTINLVITTQVRGFKEFPDA